ncbi:exodeoxyribonuclease I subunit D [Ruminiclostridium sufflavum DSM 19573]|uniref:Nuclease SbcCD subunit D n=1 Tax=Ruminiclostridium sufflavum DSM 19573 TaxID=1121337 RepID=A0A318XPE3_9FIRM|nr:exonuclease SbcCD subunit D [Ruminiclostridium sufflavum]PYG89040.1 exodeoxyribonuclease I subunit D [Ruminiclostridium sufflavum DSM 19573]
MRIIHTGDWHIGKIVNEYSMLEEQKYILQQLISVVEKEKPDAVIIAGDIYDRSIPPVEAVELVDEVFNRLLLDLRIPVLAIAGNHDSAERLSFASRILTNNGLHIAGGFNGNIHCITLQDEFGPVNFYMLPYTDPRNVSHIYADNKISTHDDAMKKIIDMIGQAIKPDERNVMITHGYITRMGEQAEFISESERPLSIGGTEFVSSDYFRIFNYSALGHLHAPQKAGEESIRYSGSILKYSFSEVNQRKGVNLVDINGEGKACTTFVPLVSKRDMRIIKGPLDGLLSPEVYKSANTEDYIYAVLTDKGELIDPISKLRTVYPNIMGLSRESINQKQESNTSAAEGYKTKSKLDLFKEFYDAMQGEPPGDEQTKIMERIIGEVDREGV